MQDDSQKRRFTELKEKSLHNDSISSDLSSALFHLQQSYCHCLFPPQLVHWAALKTDGTYSTCDALPIFYCIYFATNNKMLKTCGSVVIFPNFRDVLTFRYFHSNSLVEMEHGRNAFSAHLTFSAHELEFMTSLLANQTEREIN